MAALLVTLTIVCAGVLPSQPQPPTFPHAISQPLEPMPATGSSLSPPTDPSPQQDASSVCPCGTCEEPVDFSDLGVVCEGCGLWFHLACQNIPASQYSQLGDSQVKWNCTVCDLPNYSYTAFDLFGLDDQNSPDSFASFSSTNSKSFSPLQSSTPTRAHCQNKKRTRPLRIITINFKSIVNKFPNVANVIKSLKPDVILGTETWLDGTIANSEILPPGFNIYRKDRKRNGGGVLIAVSTHLPSHEIPELAMDDCELVWAKIPLKGKRHLILASYYHPHTNDEASMKLFASAAQRAVTTNSMIIIGGDFNFPALSWEKEQPYLKTRKNHPTLHLEFVDLINDLGLQQMVTFPTHEQNNTLDLFLTNLPSLVPRVETFPFCTDHVCVYMEFDVHPQLKKAIKRKVPLYNKADWPALHTSASTLSEAAVAIDDTETDKIWECVKHGLTSMAQDPNLIPTKTIGPGTKQHLPWLDYETLKMIRRRDRLYKWLLKAGKKEPPKPPENVRKEQKCMKEESVEESEKVYVKKKEEWKRLKGQVQRRLRCSYWSYTEKLFGDNEQGNQNPPKKFWKFIKSRRTEPASVAPLKVNGRLEYDAEKKAEALNAQFKSAFSTRAAFSAEDFEERTGVPPSPPQNSPTLSTIEITEPGVEKLLLNLNPHKAPGPDKIAPRLLKELAHELAPALTALFRSSLKTGYVPHDWRTALITPIFKKGERYCPENYRPISLTSVICKMFEHILVSSIMNFAETNQIICPEQHGFRKKRSCESQLIGLVDEISHSLERGQDTDLIVMDFSKAFDKVSHSLLLHKIRHYGITGQVNNWIESFLTGRQQAVVVDGATSGFLDVESGVPQGSVLGPCLFLLYINDLPKDLTSTARLFADDTMCHSTISNHQDETDLQKDLNLLAKWENKWCMAFHPNKCQSLTVTRKRIKAEREYHLRDHTLERTQETEYLGVTIQSNLKWDTQIARVIAKANKSLGFLRRNLRVRSQALKQLAYFALVRPCLEYACSVWDPHTETAIKQLEAVQRRAARWVVNRYRQTSSVSDMLSDLQWPSLQTRRRQARLANLFKHVNNLMVIDSSVAPSPQTPNPLRPCTRQSHPLTFENKGCRTSYRQSSFFPRTIREWNALPEPAVLSKTLEAFRGRL